MKGRQTKSGLAIIEGRNARKDKMRAFRTRTDPQARLLEKELKTLDDRIEVDFVDPEAARVPLEDRAPGLLPGRWHIIVKTEFGVDDHYFPIVAPDGSMAYRDPELAIVEEMKARDLWKPHIFDELTKGWEEDASKLRRREITEGEARIEQVAAAYRAAKRVPGDGGEHRSHAAKRRGEGIVLPPGVTA